VPQRWVHAFTLVEVAQLGLLLFIGHSPWKAVRLLFPLALIAFIPLRHFAFPRLFRREHLEVLDGAH
jgi:sodium borate transporter 11